MSEPRIIDLSSNEKHINVNCPICWHYDMVKVNESVTHKTNCECGLEYTMKRVDDRNVKVRFKITDADFSKY